MKTDETRKYPLMPDECFVFESDKNSYNAAEFYERYVDRLGDWIKNDDQYPDIPLTGMVYHCCTNRDAVNKWCATPHYSQQSFHKTVADGFGTTIKEMNQHWRGFK